MIKSKLRVFVAQHCPGCLEAIDIAGQVKQDYAQAFSVEVIDISDKQAIIPERVFATPTYMIDERVVSLGNPSQEQIKAWAEAAKVGATPAEEPHGYGC